MVRRRSERRPLICYKFSSNAPRVGRPWKPNYLKSCKNSLLCPPERRSNSKHDKIRWSIDPFETVAASRTISLLKNLNRFKYSLCSAQTVKAEISTDSTWATENDATSGLGEARASKWQWHWGTYRATVRVVPVPIRKGRQREALCRHRRREEEPCGSSSRDITAESLCQVVAHPIETLWEPWIFYRGRQFEKKNGILENGFFVASTSVQSLFIVFYFKLFICTRKPRIYFSWWRSVQHYVPGPEP